MEPRLQNFRFDLAGLGSLHPLIRAEDWLSPLIRRLLGERNYRDSEREVVEYFCPIQVTENGNRRVVTLTWSGFQLDFERCIRTYQEPVVTEFAALGLACVAVHDRTLEITEVTRRGEASDYWLGDRELMLEVSGQQQGDLRRLLQEKLEQLRSNPHGKSGYVFVANFSRLEAWLCFCDCSAD